MKFILLFFIPFSAMATLGKIFYLKGEVDLYRNGKKHVLKKTTELYEKDRIVSGERALVIIALKHGSKIKLNSESEIVLKSEQEHYIQKGSSFFHVLKRKLQSKQERFKVLSKNVAMGVRGTEFFVSTGGGQGPDDVWMCVKEGEVELSRDRQKVVVKQGEGVKAQAGGKISPPKPLVWTKALNWNFDPTQGEIENKISIDSAYTDLLDQEYD